jgi:hypothetical protein
MQLSIVLIRFFLLIFLCISIEKLSEGVIENGVTILKNENILLKMIPRNNRSNNYNYFKGTLHFNYSILLLDRTRAKYRRNKDIIDYNYLARKYKLFSSLSSPTTLRLDFYKIATLSIQNVSSFIERLPVRPTKWPSLYVIQHRSPSLSPTSIKEMESIDHLSSWLLLLTKNITTIATTTIPLNRLNRPKPMHIVSFPRSGQHLLHSLISSISNLHDLYLSFCERYQDHNYCSVESTMRKNHDFHLTLSIQNTSKRVVRE